MFASANDISYGGYSAQRPGENTYGVTVIQPFDVNHKREMRVVVARRAKRVLEAQYQNAVRMEIDNLYTAFVNVLAERESVRYLEASLRGFDELIQVTRQQLRGKQIPVMTLDRMEVQHESVALALDEANSAYARATQELATLLNLALPSDGSFQVQGNLLTEPQEIPPLDDLVGIAWANRPDIVAYRLGVQRARADVGLAQREGFPDVFVLYSPWELRNNNPTGGQNATAWSLGAMASVPLFNRNQGNVRRARVNVSQTRTELAGIERQVEDEVRSVHRNFQTAAPRGPTAGEQRDSPLSLHPRSDVQTVPDRAGLRDRIPQREARIQRNGASISRRPDQATPSRLAPQYRGGAAARLLTPAASLACDAGRHFLRRSLSRHATDVSQRQARSQDVRPGPACGRVSAAGQERRRAPSGNRRPSSDSSMNLGGNSQACCCQNEQHLRAGLGNRREPEIRE